MSVPLIKLLLLGLGFAALQAQVVVAPRSSTLLPGRTLTLKARMAGGPGQGPAPWRWRLLDDAPGALDPATGLYQAPPSVDDPQLVRLRAEARDESGEWGEAEILLLPQDPFAVIAQALGPDWLEPFPGGLPFLDLATGERFGPEAQVEPWDPTAGRAPRFVYPPIGQPRLLVWSGPGSRDEGLRPVDLEQMERLVQGQGLDPLFHYAGYGLPITLRWQPAAGAQAQLLSYREGDNVVRRDVTGLDALEVTLRGRVDGFTVEALQRLPGKSRWRSQMQRFPLHLRGLLPLAGNPLAGAGHADAAGLSARLREPFGLVQLEDREAGRLRLRTLVADAGSHVIREVGEDGRVTTLCGRPDQPGHQDGAFQEARFRGPTHLAALETWGGAWECLLADSGNHCVRRIGEDGRVATLAGTPGQAGNRDADTGAGAAFSDPQGLAMDTGGNLYVADRGNRAIRKVAPGGRVTTLAGAPDPQFPGSRDGQGPDARFTRLKGMAFEPLLGYGPALLVLDGHAVRRVSLPDGQVTTVLGQVDQPGSQDVQDGEPERRLAALAGPCLDDPASILWSPGGCLIADTGNHAVRQWVAEDATLTTVAGAPGQGEIRWGLLRDGMPGPQGPGHATLEAPRSLSYGDGAVIRVSTGPCVAELSSGLRLRDQLGRITLECPPARRNQPLTVRFSVPATTIHREPASRPIDYVVDFLNADGSLADRVEGQGRTGPQPMAAVGLFTQAGRGKVVVRCVTGQGVGRGTQAEIQVE